MSDHGLFDDCFGRVFGLNVGKSGRMNIYFHESFCFFITRQPASLVPSHTNALHLLHSLDERRGPNCVVTGAAACPRVEPTRSPPLPAHPAEVPALQVAVSPPP